MAGFAGGYLDGFAQEQEEDVEICNTVEHFVILKRPPRITEADVDFLESLPGIGEDTLEPLKARLQEGPITNLDELEETGIPKDGKVGRLLRVFYSIGGPCTIDVRSPLNDP